MNVKATLAPDDLARACADAMWENDSASAGLGMTIVDIGAGGQEGVAKAISIIAKELETTMGLCGVNTIAEIDEKVIAV